MAKYCLKKRSKRIACAKRFKIEKKVREHNKKLKKQAKKNVLRKRRNRDKPINIPNKCPFKEEILLEAEKAREEAEARRRKLIEMAKKKRIEKVHVGMKRKTEHAVNDLEKFIADALKKKEGFSKKSAVESTSEENCMRADDKTMRLYAGEVRKTIEMADIIIEVLDARDPLGSRCAEVEKCVISAGKRLVLLLNKIDLVPKENAKKWLAYLRTQMPTIAFRASTQQQKQKLGHVGGTSFLVAGSKCIGAELLMKLLANYCRNKDIKTSIRVGVVGHPNVGKSSVINSLKRKRACNVGALPGITKQTQEVELDKHIRLLDSPGVVLASKSRSDAIEMALRNAVRVDRIYDPVGTVEGILRRCRHDTLMMHYMIPKFYSCEEFLAMIARKLGKLGKGARPDIYAAAYHVLNDWNSSGLCYYTEPPEMTSTADMSAGSEQFCSSELLNAFSKEFDLDVIDGEQMAVVEGLPSSSAMDVGLLYRGNIPVEIKEDAISMEVDTATVSEGRTVVADTVKKNKAGSSDGRVKGVLPGSLKIVGNVQLSRCIKSAVKRQKRENRKMARSANALADSMGMTMIADEQEDYGFEKLGLL